MKYNVSCMFMGSVFKSMTKKEVKDHVTLKRITDEYKSIVKRAKDIGKNNTLLSSYLLAAYFIALCRNSGLSVEANYHILESGFKENKLVKKFLGNEKSYFSKKHNEKRRKWSKLTHMHQYENDWVVDFLEKTSEYEFGFNYLECGVCKLCKDENCFELASYLCKLDYLLVDLVGVKLTRTKTLAGGDDCCDFRFNRR